MQPCFAKLWIQLHTMIFTLTLLFDIHPRDLTMLYVGMLLGAICAILPPCFRSVHLSTTPQMDVSAIRRCLDLAQGRFVRLMDSTWSRCWHYAKFYPATLSRSVCISTQISPSSLFHIDLFHPATVHFPPCLIPPLLQPEEHSRAVPRTTLGVLPHYQY